MPDAARLGDLPRRFTEKMERALGEWPTPGINVAILIDDEVVWTHAVGFARLEPAVPLTTRHLHRVGSITKLFTAQAILLLHDDGRLDLDDPVSKWVPEFQPAGPNVTLRHILCHGSGITGEGGHNVWESGVFPDEAEFRRMIRVFQPVAAPMVHLKYSNAAYSMLGLVVEASSGVPYEKFVLDRILRRLGMDDTRFHLEPADDDRFARGHFMPPLQRRFEEAPHQDLKAFTACGMLLSTPSDLLKLARAQWSEPALLSAPLAAEARRVQLIDPETPGWRMGYGLGWRQIRRGDRIYIGHSGAYLGNRCALEISYPDRVAVALFSNLGGGDAAIEMAMDFADAVIEERKKTSPQPDGRPLPRGFGLLLGHYSMHRWYEATIRYDGRRLIFSSGLDPSMGVPLEQVSEDRFRIMAGREVGEELVVTKRATDGTVMEFHYAGERMRRL